MKPYVDRIFESYRSLPDLPSFTMKEWLDEQNWRKHLRSLGMAAKKVCNIKDPEAARGEWEHSVSTEAKKTFPWTDVLTIVPLLKETAASAKTDNKVFVQFMKDLATLAKL